MDAVREMPSGRPPTRESSARDTKPAAILKSPVTVWLRSTFVDSERYLRFGRHVEFEGASWPLGIQFALDKWIERDTHKLERLRVALHDEILFPIIDNAFDEHARAAWQLPWWHSRVYISPRNRRSAANFVMVNVGDWLKGRPRYDDIKLLLEHHRPSIGGAGMIREIYALTPFCIIVQQDIEDSEHAIFDGVFHTYIVSFYTFETFVQECLVLEAMRKGIAPDSIVTAYEHVYCNSSAIPEAVPTNLAELELAKLVGLPVDWSAIRTTASGSSTIPQARRRGLFQLRLQTHLTIAIAVACHGIRAFTEVGAGSPLVRPASSLPAIDDLAPFWLRHMMGAYDYAAEGERLLANVARRYGTNLALDRFGVLTAEPLPPRNSAELAVMGSGTPILRNRADPQAADRLRWPLFEFSLDNESLLNWQRAVGGE
jgi:hypothetical protein